MNIVTKFSDSDDEDFNEFHNNNNNNINHNHKKEDDLKPPQGLSSNSQWINESDAEYSDIDSLNHKQQTYHHQMPIQMHSPDKILVHSTINKMNLNNNNNISYPDNNQSMSSRYHLPKQIPSRDDIILELGHVASEKELHDSAIILMQRQEYEESLLRLEAITIRSLDKQSRTTYSSKAFTLLLEIYSIQKNWKTALNTALDFVHIHGLEIESCHCALAYIYTRMDRNIEAIKACDEGIRLFTKSDLIYTVRAKCYQYINSHKNATQDLEKAILLRQGIPIKSNEMRKKN
jgi:tetratricopeptide (TPR) repeat protein